MLACHDLRTPLATVHGFAHTLGRNSELDDASTRYVEMIGTASGQMAELLDELSVAARLAAGRYDPPLRAIDTLELAEAAAAGLGEERVEVSGEGAESSSTRTPSSEPFPRWHAAHFATAAWSRCVSRCTARSL